MGISFRHSAGFGKRMEYNLVGKMLMEGLDVYLPLVDDHGVDCVIKKEVELLLRFRLRLDPVKLRTVMQRCFQRLLMI